MDIQIITTSVFVAGFIIIIFVSEYLHKKLKINSEFTRKFAHITATLSSIVFAFTIKSHWYVLFLSSLFFLVLFLGKRRNSFKSIDNVKRKTGGSYLLPISIYLLFYISIIFESKLLFILPMLVLGISDPLAGIFGTIYRKKTRKINFQGHKFNKTELGSSVFFVSTFLISFFSFYVIGLSAFKILIASLIIASIATLTELISSKGIDNISVPMIIVAFILTVG